MSKRSIFPEKRKVGEKEDEAEFARLSLQPAKRQRNLTCSSTESIPILSWQPYLPIFETLIQKTVREVVEDAVSRRFAISVVPRGPIQAGPSKQYRLHFCNNLPKMLFTNSVIEAEGRKPIEITIIDCISNKPVTHGPFSSLKVELLALDGDFCSDARTEWTKKEFESSILRKREGKRQLLMGQLILTLNNGSVSFGDVKFTDNSRSRSGKFRLGARVYKNECADYVLEAVTKSFAVKDNRGESYQKIHPPSLDDYVWRLEMIHRNGVFHERLTKNNIFTVGDFLKNFVRDHDWLRNLLGNGMSKKTWDKLVKHAWECTIPNNNYYTYRSSRVELLFNAIHQLVGAEIDNCYYKIHELPAIQRELVNKLKQDAYRNPDQIIKASEEIAFKITQGFLFQNEVVSTVQTANWPDEGELPPLPSYLHIPSLLENVTDRDEILAQPSTSQVEQPTLPTNYPNSWNDYGEMQTDCSTSWLDGPIRTPEEASLLNSEADFPQSVLSMFLDILNDFGQVLAGENSGARNVSVSRAGFRISFNCVKLLAALKWRAIAKRSRKASIKYPAFSYASPGVC